MLTTVTRPATKIFSPVKIQGFRWTKNTQQRWIKTASLTERCQSWAASLRLQTSTVAFQVTQSVVAVSVLPKSRCFWYKFSIQRSRWATLLLATKLFYSFYLLGTLENAVQKWPSWKCKSFFTAWHKRAY